MEFEGVEMSAMLYDHYFWPVSDDKAFAIIFTDISTSFDVDGMTSDSLAECWLGLFSKGVLEKTEKMPCKDIRWSPNLEAGAPYGRKFTVAVVFNQNKAKVINAVTGEAVFAMYGKIERSKDSN